MRNTRFSMIIKLLFGMKSTTLLQQKGKEIHSQEIPLERGKFVSNFAQQSFLQFVLTRVMFSVRISLSLM